MADNTISLLASINSTLTIISRELAPQNGNQGRKTVASLSKGSIDGVKGSSLATDGMKSLNTILSSMSGLPQTVNDVSKLNDKTINNFMDVIKRLIESINGVKVDVKQAEATKNLLNAMSTLGSLPKQLSESVKYMPGAWIATKMFIPIIKGFGKILDEVGKIKDVKRRTGKLNQMMSAADAIKKFCLTCALMVMVCVGLGVLLTKPVVWGMMLAGFAGIIVMGAMMMGTMKLLELASKYIKKKIPKVKGLFMFYALAAVLVVASLGVYAIIKKHWLHVLAGFGYLTFMVVVIAGVMWLVSKLARPIKSSAKDVVAIGAVYLLAGALVFLCKWVGDYITKPENSKAIMNGFLGLSAMVIALSLAMRVIKKVASRARKAIVNIALLELCLGGALGLMLFANLAVEKIGDNGGKIALLMTGCIGMIAAVSLLAAAVGAIPKSVLLLGIATIALVEVLIAGTLGIMLLALKVIERTKTVYDTVGGKAGIKTLADFVKNDIKDLLGAFTPANIMPPISLADSVKLAARFSLLSVACSGLANCATMLARMGAMVDANGRIHAVKGVNKETGEFIFDDNGIDVALTATSICTAVSEFVKNCNFGWSDVKKMVASAAVFEILGMVADPINSFLNMITGFVGEGTGDNMTLTPIVMGEDGKLTKGQAVPVKDTALSICTAISTFTTNIFSKENETFWRNVTRSGAARALRKILNPVTSFIDGVKKLTEESQTNTESLNNALSPFNTIKSILEPYYDGTIDAASVKRNVGAIKTVVDDGIKTVAGSTSTVVKNLGTEIDRTKNALNDFDSVLADKDNKRRNSFKDFSEDVGDLLNKFKDAENGLNQFNTAVSNASSYERQTSTATSSSSAVSENQATSPAGQLATQKQQENLVESIRTAITDAIGNMSMTLVINGEPSNLSTGDDIKSIFNNATISVNLT